MFGVQVLNQQAIARVNAKKIIAAQEARMHRIWAFLIVAVLLVLRRSVPVSADGVQYLTLNVAASGTITGTGDERTRS